MDLGQRLRPGVVPRRPPPGHGQRDDDHHEQGPQGEVPPTEAGSPVPRAGTLHGHPDRQNHRAGIIAGLERALPAESRRGLVTPAASAGRSARVGSQLLHGRRPGVHGAIAKRTARGHHRALGAALGRPDRRGHVEEGVEEQAESPERLRAFGHRSRLGRPEAAQLTRLRKRLLEQPPTQRFCLGAEALIVRHVVPLARRRCVHRERSVWPAG